MIDWKNLRKETYSDILLNVSEVIFNMYYSNYSRTLYEDMRQFMMYKMMNVISTTGVDTMRSLRNYLMMIARNGGSMYLYHDTKNNNLIELTDLNTPSIDFDYVEELSSQVLYGITSKFLDFGDYTKILISIFEDYGVKFDSWYSINVSNEPVKNINYDLLYMLKSLVVWELVRVGDEYE